MIRPFDQLKDLERAMVLLEQLRRAGEYRGMVPAWDRVINLLAEKERGRGGRCWVAEREGKLSGLLVGVHQPLWWADPTMGWHIATDLLFTSTHPGDGKALIQSFVTWALANPKIGRIEMALSGSKTELATVERIYGAAGLKREGSFYVLNSPAYQDMLDRTVKEA